MENIEIDQTCTKGSDPEKAPTIVHAEEVDKQNPKGVELEETINILHPEEGGRHDHEGNYVKETPDVGHCLGDNQKNLERNDTGGAPKVVGEGDGIPYVGMKFDSEYEAYNFYNAYAARIGFSIRRAKVRYTANGVLRQRYYFCSKQGLKVDNRSCSVNTNELEARTDCKARIRFAVTDGVWEVTYFNPDHNHALANPEQRKFLRSYGKVLETRSSTSKSSQDIENPDEDEGNVVIPSIGMKVYSEEEAYNLYNKYAAHVGFSIRRSKCLYNARGLLRQRYYVCSKQGVKEDDESYGGKKLDRWTAKTGCKASIRFKVADGVWEVIYFKTDHNHELAEPDQRKFLRSMRKLSRTHPFSMELRPKGTYSCLTEVNRAENVRFPLPDCHNLLHTTCYSMMEPKDAQSLTNYFKHKQLEDTMFFYTVQVASNNHVAGFFWRDGRSRIDYDCFGDVVLFDTAFRTNKYNLVCAPFEGVNHHGKNVLFGCAILLEDTVASFTWLFETFLESMGSRHPKTIFTNQCQAMSDAITQVFPKTCHRLSLCHIVKDAKQKLSSLYADSEFKRLFGKCLNGCCTEEEFQSTWDELIKTFDLVDNNWLKTIYELREKWCPTFSLDTFSANLRSTERTEGIRDDFHYMSCKPTNLEEFLRQYEETAKKMRLVELEDDLHCNQGLPARASRSSGILMQAADVYTIEIFRLFQEEMVESLSIVMKELSSDGALHMYELTEEGHKVGHVLDFNSDTCTAVCNCKMFESMGILCRHALRVLNMKNVTKIPSQYILKRWTKGAREGMVVPGHDESSYSTAESSQSLLRRRLMHKAFCAVDKSLMTARGSMIADVLLDQLIEQAHKQTSTLNFMVDTHKEDSESSLNDSIDDTNKEHCSLENHTHVSQKGATNISPESQIEKKRKRMASKSSLLPVQQSQQTVLGPSTALFQPPQIPAFFGLSLQPLRDGTVSNSHVFPSGVQGHVPTWTFGNSNFVPVGVLQGTVQMPHANQDNSKSRSNHTTRLRPIYPKNSDHTVGQLPNRSRGTESS